MAEELARKRDGSAGDADYGVIGKTYSDYRRPDPRIAQAVRDALGDAQSVLNVGAGAGNYEPTGRDVTAIEPSVSMRAQRPESLSVAIDAVAESLPFPDKSFDAAMTTFSVHQWGDVDAGLAEMRRVTRGPIAILTCDPALLDRFWLAEYAPEVISAEAGRYPEMSRLASGLGGEVSVDPVPIPLDCTDGFNEAYYGRPEGLLVAGARAACSAWSFVDPGQAETYAARLSAAIDSGEWDALRRASGAADLRRIPGDRSRAADRVRSRPYAHLADGGTSSARFACVRTRSIGSSSSSATRPRGSSRS